MAAESKRPDKSRAANQGGNPRYRLDSVSLVSDLLPLIVIFMCPGGRCRSVNAWYVQTDDRYVVHRTLRLLPVTSVAVSPHFSSDVRGKFQRVFAGRGDAPTGVRYH